MSFYEGISSLGTVLQRVRPGKRNKTSLNPSERNLLDHALSLGLTAPDFYAVHKLANLALWPSPALLCLLLCERIATGEGSTFLSLDPESLSKRLKLFGLNPRDIEAIFTKAHQYLRKETHLFAKNANRTVPFVLREKENALYRHSHFVAEQNCTKSLKKLLSRPWFEPKGLEKAVTYVTQTQPLGDRPYQEGNDWKPILLAKEQELAARIAIHAPLTIISGGPGTGKTSIVVTILRLLHLLGVPTDQIYLAAPTGRAANRLGEAIRKGLASIREDAPTDLANIEPKTLHRLLGWSPVTRQFRFNKENPLTADWVIIDEASMVDLLLMENLLMALPAKTRLILLGDANQLPSVEAGAVFRDLVFLGNNESWPTESPKETALFMKKHKKEALKRHVVYLKRAFRQKDDAGGRQIQQLATQIHQGNAASLFDNTQDFAINKLHNPNQFNWTGVCLFEPQTRESIDLFIAHLFERYYRAYKSLCRSTLTDPETDRQRLEMLFSASEQLRILCLTHHGRNGTETINRLFTEKFHSSPRRFFPGLPWMITHNDYQQGLYNGDTGISLYFNSHLGRSQWLVFRSGSGFKRVPFDAVSGLEPAFAMTVHKSQGSETDHVVLLLPENPNSLCKREVIYTALTRAKKSVLVVGNPKTLEQAVASGMDRVTGLKAKLGAEKT